MKPEQQKKEETRKNKAAAHKAGLELSAKLPVCPYCGDDPVNFSVRNYPVGAMMASAAFSGNPDCRKLFTFQILGSPRPRNSRASSSRT